MLGLDESVEQENADAPTDRTSRRERRDEAAGTLSRVFSDWSRAAIGEQRERIALLP